MGFFSRLFGEKHPSENIETAILMVLDKEEVGTCFHGIDYVDAVVYAKKYGKITNVIGDTYLEFIVTLDNKKIAVTLSKEPFGKQRSAIFRASTNLDTIYQEDV